ncbi:hypothetical protein [Streptomyces sp. NPDC096132]
MPGAGAGAGQRIPGPGPGLATARRFGTAGHTVALISRTAENLDV